MKPAITVIRQSLPKGEDLLIFNDRLKNRPGYNQVRSLKIAFTQFCADTEQKIISALSQEGYDVVKSYFSNGPNSAIKGHRFIVGIPG